MQIEGSTVLVTGARRGLGRAFVDELRHRGAAKIYAAARKPETLNVAGIVPLTLDVTDPVQVTAAAETASDVTVLINNAGVSTYGRLITGDLDDIRLEAETNYFGTLAMMRAFAPHLADNGGGAMLNVLSVMAWLGMDGSGGYSASKAAAWAMTNSARLELAGQGTQVTGLVLASTDTDMMAGFDVPKNDPALVVADALDGLEAGELEVLADPDSVAVKANLSRDPAEVYPQLARARNS